MFSESERRDLRDDLLFAARSDDRISAAAIVGSAAAGREDRWSDIDLAFRVAADVPPEQVAEDWTSRMYDSHHGVEHLDIWSGPTLFRVFLLTNSLQVDLSFWPDDAFAASGDSFRLVFGAANGPMPQRPTDRGSLIGMGWLYALHARSSIARGRALQALFMVNGVRDQAIALACLRHGLNPHQGRGVDDLPEDVRGAIVDSVMHGLDATEQLRSFGAATALLLGEAEYVDPALASRLGARSLSSCARPTRQRADPERRQGRTVPTRTITFCCDAQRGGGQLHLPGTAADLAPSATSLGWSPGSPSDQRFRSRQTRYIAPDADMMQV